MSVEPVWNSMRYRLAGQMNPAKMLSNGLASGSRRASAAKAARGSAFWARTNPAMGTGAALQASPRLAQGQAQGVAAPAMPFILLIILLCSLLLPTWTSFYVGSMRLTAYRLVLLAVVVPCAWKVYLPGHGGKPLIPDWCMLFFAGWSVLALLVNLGPDAIQTAGILVVETLGGYCLARCCIVRSKDLMRFAKWLFWIVVCLLPFTLLEMAYRVNIINPGAPRDIGERFGLNRACGPFDHPILNGVFCGSSLGLAWFCFGRTGVSMFGRSARIVLVAMSAMTSVSSGAMAVLSSQSLLLGWNHLTRKIPRRWLVLAGVFGLLYLAVAMFSNRTPMTVGLYYLTFSPDTAYGRVAIWDGGVAEVWRHPILGNGTGQWQHPTWMSGSMDNFWLLNAVMFGLPSALAILGTGVYTLWRLGRAPFIRDSDLDRCRRGWMCSFTGLAVGAFTVHLWNSSFVLLGVLLGSGVWMVGQASEIRLSVESPTVFRQSPRNAETD